MALRGGDIQPERADPEAEAPGDGGRVLLEAGPETEPGRQRQRRTQPGGEWPVPGPLDLQEQPGGTSHPGQSQGRAAPAAARIPAKPSRMTPIDGLPTMP